MIVTFTTDSKTQAQETVSHLIQEWNGSEPLTLRLDVGENSTRLVAFTSGKEPSLT